MAGVAIGAVPHVVAHTGMLLVGLRLRVAIRTNKNREIRLIGVAVAAQLRCVVRNPEPCVVEGRAQPGRGRVASSARGGKSRRNVVGVVRPLEIGLVTRVAISRRSFVDAANVATSAWNGHVRAR